MYLDASSIREAQARGGDRRRFVYIGAAQLAASERSSRAGPALEGPPPNDVMFGSLRAAPPRGARCDFRNKGSEAFRRRVAEEVKEGPSLLGGTRGRAREARPLRGPSCFQGPLTQRAGRGFPLSPESLASGSDHPVLLAGASWALRGVQLHPWPLPTRFQ